MLALCVLKAFGETKINDVDVIFVSLITTDEEIVWFDISVDHSLVMHLLNSFDNLNTDEAYRLKVKPSLALLEEIF